MIAAGKIYISPVMSFYIDVYFPLYYFTTGNLRLPVLHFIPHISQTNSSISMNSPKFENVRTRMFAVSPFTPAHNFVTVIYIQYTVYKFMYIYNLAM